MLTIKHVESGGNEGVVEAKSVHMRWRAPRRLFAYGVANDGGAVVDGVATYGDGVVYVMNAAGSTVAKYDLDATI